MSDSRSPLHLIAGTAVLATLLLVSASAQVAQAQNKDEEKCVNTVNKNAAKLAATQGKENAGCVKGAVAGKLTTTAEACLTADSKQKVSKATVKLTDSRTERCAGVANPNPPFNIADGSAMAAAAVDEEIALTGDVFGSPLDSAIQTGDGGKCQSGVSKAYEKYAATRVKAIVGCKKDGLKADTVSNSTTLQNNCMFPADTKGKVGKAKDKIMGAIDKCAPGVDLSTAFPGECSAQVANSLQLGSCLAAAADCRVCLFINGADGIAAPCDQLDNGVVDQTCRQCGNGATEAPETCDDSGESATCDADCTAAVCGDGTTNATAGEDCDDSGESATCDSDCTTATCGDGTTNVTAGEQCDDDGSNSDVTPDACRTNCQLPSCGDGVTDTGEDCDDAGESATCDANCTFVLCGDGTVNATAGELCDDAGESATCDTDCTPAACGDGTTNATAGELCDDNNLTDGDGCDSNCTPTGCGNGITTAGEQCDDGGESASCDTDCTFAACGDGTTNASAGEDCDDSGESATCDADCTTATCGDGTVNATAGEFCDDSGESATCDADCTAAACGDGTVNASAGEDCDDSGESATCDSDCTDVACGDGTLNVTAGEECDDGGLTPGDGCSASCTCGPGSGEIGCNDPQCPNRGQLIIYAGVRETPCSTNTDCEVEGVLVGECDTGLGQCVTSTDLDTGWTGFAHNSDIDDGLITRGKLLCEGPFDGLSPEPCGDCLVVGLDTSYGDLCRCNNDNQAICTNGFNLDPADCSTGVSCSTDADCKRCSVNTGISCNLDADCPLGGGGGEICLNGNRQPTCSAGQCVGTCNCYFGPPLPLSSGSTPACVLNKFANDISGTANVDLGSGSITANLKAVVFLGELVTVPCPYCTGDTTPRDGNRDGTCVLGDNPGDACDVQAVNLTFPSPGGDGYSLDCFPAIGKNVSGTGLVIDLVQTTSSDSLAAAVPCGLGGASLCPCARCSDDISQTCTSDAQCGTCTVNADCAPMGNAGLCNGGLCKCKGPGLLNPVPNQCSNANCVDSGDGINGACETGPDDKYCDGAFRGNGEPFVTCVTNADCDNTECGSGVGVGLCGTCSLIRRRECFLNPINVTGFADPETPAGAALFCAAETSNPGINSVAGLPGPGRIVNQTRAKTFCASDPGTEYIPGTGGCP